MFHAFNSSLGSFRENVNYLPITKKSVMKSFVSFVSAGSFCLSVAVQRTSCLDNDVEAFTLSSGKNVVCPLPSSSFQDCFGELD